MHAALTRLATLADVDEVFAADAWRELSGGEIRRESLFGELRQRIRDVRAGPDGLLHRLTDEPADALLVIEPGSQGGKAQDGKAEDGKAHAAG